MVGDGSSEEKKLELRLGPPGQEDWRPAEGNNLFYPNMGFLEPDENHKFSAPFFHYFPATNTRFLDLQAAGNNNPAVPKSSSHKSTAPSQVIGWPPIRSFRKNLASSSKPSADTQNVDSIPEMPPFENPVETCRKGLFVKINMDGVPIGRKVDLKAYSSYDHLSSAVDDLFRGLLAAQKDVNKEEPDKSITGILNGSEEYTLVYEDNEGDRMLVGDVPWNMFVSTAKRLRVLKSSDISGLSFGSSK